MEQQDGLLQMLLGSVMTQVAVLRFLLQEKIIDRKRLLDFLQQRGQTWGKTATDEALIPLVTLVTALEPDEEPEFPKTIH
jgi:hypothetical protein